MRNQKTLRSSVIVAAAILASLGLAGCGTTPAPESTTTTVAATEATQDVIQLGEQRSPAEGTTGNVTVTADSVIVGNPDAPKSMTVYIDLMCPHCKTLHEVMAADKAEWAAGSDVSVAYVVVDYLGPRTTHGYSYRAANLLALIADVDPESWPAAMSALLAAQPATTTDVVSDDQMLQVARDAGAQLSDEDVATLSELNFYDWVQRATDHAAAAGVNYIPQIWIDGALVAGETHEETAQLVRDAVN